MNKAKDLLILPAGRAGGEDDASDSGLLFLPSLWSEVKHKWMPETKEEDRKKQNTDTSGRLSAERMKRRGHRKRKKNVPLVLLTVFLGETPLSL